MDGSHALPERIKGSVASVKNRFAATCSETAANLSGYLEHDLAFRRRRRVARHLRRCSRCRSLLHSLAWTIEQLRMLGTREVAAPGVAETVVERIRDEAAEPSS
jgi:predicted anti-sigma-YlaC factor YlaD